VVTSRSWHSSICALSPQVAATLLTGTRKKNRAAAANRRATTTITALRRTVMALTLTVRQAAVQASTSLVATSHRRHGSREPGPYSGAVGQDRMPAFEEHWRAFDEMIEYTRGLVEDSGTEDLGYVEQGQIGVYDVTPHNLRASAINIIAEQSLIVTVGGFGGRWELDYTDEHRELGRRIIAATVAGRIEERHAFGRSRVSVTLDDGTIKRATGYDGCGSLFIPQPGWTRWGERTSFEPFQI